MNTNRYQLDTHQILLNTAAGLSRQGASKTRTSNTHYCLEKETLENSTNNVIFSNENWALQQSRLMQETTTVFVKNDRPNKLDGQTSLKRT